MTTPKRYKELARELRGLHGMGPLGTLQPQEVSLLADALATVAREAQVRVLEAYAKEARALDGDLLFTLRSRIERGEDL